MKQYKGRRDTRLYFEVRKKKGVYHMILVNPFAAPAVRDLLSAALAAWQSKHERTDEPNKITVGIFSENGFKPLPAWLPIWDIETAQDRLAYDLQRLYGPDGPFGGGQ